MSRFGFHAGSQAVTASGATWVTPASQDCLDAVFAIEADEMAPDCFPRFFFTQALGLFGPGFLVARIDDEIAGYALLGRHAEDRDAELYSVVVGARWRGRGAGEALTRACIEVAQRWTCDAVRLSVSPGNAVARRLYETVGFERCGFEPGYYGVGVDRVLMRLALSAVAA